MAKIKVLITELLTNVVEVEAESEEEALKIVRGKYSDEEIVLTHDNYFETNFEIHRDAYTYTEDEERKIIEIPGIGKWDLYNALDLLRYFEKGSYITKSHFINKTDLSEEKIDTILNYFLENNMFQKVYAFWCNCDEEQIDIITQEEYDKKDYIMCEACETEYEKEKAKHHYTMKYKILIDFREYL